MPAGLRRYYGKGHLHFITFSCYRRLPLLKTVRARDIFVKELGKVRDEMGFRLLGYVVMPEHVPVRSRGSLRRKEEKTLQRVPRGSHKIAQHGDVRPIGPNAASIHRQAQTFGEIQIHTRIIEFRQTETLRGQHAVQPGRIHRTGRAVTPAGGHLLRGTYSPFYLVLIIR
jgi:hypothetical protein